MAYLRSSSSDLPVFVESANHHVPLPTVIMVTPLNIQEFQQELSDHPDRGKVQFVLDGIRDGTGFLPDRGTLASRNRDMKSASEHQQVIDDYT